MSRRPSYLKAFHRMSLIKTLISLHPPLSRWMKFFVAVKTSDEEDCVYQEKVDEDFFVCMES